MLNSISLRSQGDAGVNFDLFPYDLPPDFFTSGNNFLLRDGKIYSFNGTKLVSTLPTHFDGAKVLLVQSLASPGTYYYLVLGKTKVECFNGTNWFDISSTAGYAAIPAGGQFNWTHCFSGNIPIINNPSHYPEYWSPQTTATILAPLKYDAGNTWSQKGWHCNVMRSHKNFLFAIGMTEGGNTYPNSYRWSHPADINGLPYSWDETDLASIAGQSSILGNMGVLVDGESMRDSFYLYSTNGITELSYVGTPYIWQARPLPTNTGLLTANCIADISGAHVFLSDGDILINNGNAIKSILHRVMRSKLASIINVSNFNLSYCVTDLMNKEVWFCIPTNGATYPNTAFIYNWVDNKISIRDINSPITGMTIGPVGFSEITFDNAVGTFNANTHSYNYSDTSPFSMKVVGVSKDNSALYNCVENDGAVLETYLERISAPINEFNKASTILTVYPHIESEGGVSIQFGSQDSPTSPIRWDSPKTFTPLTDRKIDIRTTGLIHSWRIESINDANFVYAGMDIEYVLDGER